MSDRTKPELAQWYHATMFSPVKQTGYFATWPYLTIELINKHLLQSMEKDKGHMQQTRKGLKYTKTQQLKTPKKEPMKLMVQKTNTVVTKIIDHKRLLATDLTGKFPVTSNRENKYLLFLYDYDINCVLIRPMKSRADSEFI